MGKALNEVSGDRTLKTTTPQHLDKQLVADSFKASAATYDENAIVQKEISLKLIDYLNNCHALQSSTVLEIGCCTGILSEMLVQAKEIKRIYLNDIVPEFCTKTSERIKKYVDQVVCIPGDIERCFLPADLNLVISSATFQWMSDLLTLFKNIHKALCQEGYLVFSIFGPGTMQEISSLTGRSLQYHSLERLTEMLEEHFNIITMQNEIRQIFFPNVRSVLQHIRQTGVGGLGRTKWMPGKYKEFEKQYTSRFASEKGYPVTYASTFVVAKKR
ncbi:MAG: malonyl-ACP O-methyltransferase BioC [Desulforhopalus sp.]